jgi:para-nitrobenzyl esterase
MRILLLTLALVAAGGAQPASAASRPVVGERVTVAQGALRGDDNGSVVAFRNVPYAAPPVGDRRWAPPQAPSSWAGERDATAPGNRCPQPTATGTVLGSEDCLTLSVHTPSGTPRTAERPVLIWIHGGGFNTGGGDETDPSALVTEGGLVVVSINYRLAALGFLSLPGLADGGNFGLQDQQAAMRWVRDNIRAFGGDPGRVTLYGVSAGGDSVCSQLAAPGAAGLFHRAILGSAACNSANNLDVLVPGISVYGDTWKSAGVNEGIGSTFAAQQGCTDPATALACLRALPAAAIAGSASFYFSPTIGTPTLPTRPNEAILAGTAADVPVLAGIVRDEGLLFVAGAYGANPLDAARFEAQVRTLAGPAADEVLAAYPLDGRTPNRAYADVYTDRAYACPNLETYEALGDRLWAYEFAEPDAPPFRFDPPADLAGGTPHGSDIPFLLTYLADQPDLTPAQERLARKMRAYWAAFATSGVPRAAGAPYWPRFGHHGQVLNLRSKGTAVESGRSYARRHHCDAWNTDDRPGPGRS